MTTMEGEPPHKRQKMFFVDTKSTCLLCLQKIVTDPSPSGGGSIRNIPGDRDENHATPKNPEEDGKETEGERAEKEERFCLRSIFKLLHLDGGRVFRKMLNAETILGSKVADTDLSVTLCEPCLEVSRQLSGLFRDLEVVQMKLDHSLQTVREILKNSGNDPSRMAEFRGQFLDPLDNLNGSIAHLIRRETLEKCTKHLERSLPRVSVLASRKIPLPSPTVDPGIPDETTSDPVVPGISHVQPPPIPTPPTIFRCTLCNKSCQNRGSLYQHMLWRHKEHMPSDPNEKIVMQSGMYVCTACGVKCHLKSSLTRHKQVSCKFRPLAPSPAPVTLEPESTDMSPQSDVVPNPEELLSSMPRLKGENGDDLLLCGICPSPKENQFTGDAPLKEHIFTSHPDYFFASFQLPNCSQSRFRTLCTQLRESEVASSFVQSQHDCDSGTLSNCVHCPYQCPVDQWSMYSHLVQAHHSIHAVKLVELQKLEHPGQNPTILGGHSNRYQCHGCKRVYSNYFSYRRHKRAYFCGGSKLGSSDDPINTQPFRCDDCGKTFLCQTSVSRHKKGACFHHKIASLPPGSSITSRLSPGNHTPFQPIRCKDCGKACLTAKSARRHVCAAPAAPDPPTPPQIIEEVPSSSDQPLPEERTLSTPSVRRSTARDTAFCSDCGKCMHPTNISRHRKTNCPYQPDRTPHRSPVLWFKCLWTNCDLEFDVHSNLQDHISETHGTKAPSPDNRFGSSETIPNDRCTYCESPLSKGQVCPCGRGKGLPATTSDECYCSDCGKKLLHKKSMWRHRKMNCPYRNLEAPGEPPGVFKCWDCKHVQFTCLSDLRQHVASVHLQNGTTISCEHCGSSLLSHTHLIRHQQRHCPVIKAAAEGTAPTTAPPELTETATFYGEDAPEEGEPAVVDEGSFIFPTKIEVLELSEGQLSGGNETTPQGASEVKMETPLRNEGAAQYWSRSQPPDFPPGGQDGGDGEENGRLIVPDDMEDPLSF